MVVHKTPADPNTAVSSVNSGIPVKIFPNPAHNKFTLINPGNLSMKMFDIQGNLKLEKNKCTASETVDIACFSNGMYFLWLNNDKQTTVVKLVKN
jgi:hypothetical protein